MYHLLTRQLLRADGTRTAQLLKQKLFKIQCARLSAKQFEHLDVDETNQGKNGKLHRQIEFESVMCLE